MQPRPSLTLDDLLVIEQDERLLDFRMEHDGLLFWPYIRSQLFLAAFLDAHDCSTPHASREPLGFGKLSSYIWNTVCRCPFVASPDPGGILILSSGIVNVIRNSGYFNRLNDYFASCAPNKTWILEDSVRSRYRRPRSYSKVYYHDLIPILGQLCGKIHRVSGKDENSITALIAFLRERFPYRFKTEPWQELGSYLFNVVNRVGILHWCYDALFRMWQPKLLALEDASYGTRGHIIKWAKEHGIVTVEFQHGLVSRNHIAYNYGPLGSSPDYRLVLPDYFLVYGEFWKEQIHTPSKCIVIGNPNLSEYLKEIEIKKPMPGCKTVLYCSGGMTPENTLNFVNGLAELLDKEEYSIVFRPHPGEAPWFQERYGQLSDKYIEIDLHEELYPALNRSDFVFGEGSTVLFEALAFHKTTFAVSHSYYDLHLPSGDFIVVSTPLAAADKIKSGLIPPVSMLNHYWASGWRENYMGFLRTIDVP